MGNGKMDANDILDSKHDGGILNSDIIKALEDVEYDLEEYVDENSIVSESIILRTLTGVESAPEYYEVQPGENIDFLIKRR